MGQYLQLAQQVQRPFTEIRQPISVPSEPISATAKKPDAVRRLVQAGDWVEWLSPALPKQQGEVLAVYQDGTFEVFHPITEILCRLPVEWVTRILNGPMSTTLEGPTS